MSETAALPDDAYPGSHSVPLWPLAAGLALACVMATMATVMAFVVRSDVSSVERRVHKAVKMQKSVREDIASLREDLQALQAQPDPLPEPPPVVVASAAAPAPNVVAAMPAVGAAPALSAAAPAPAARAVAPAAVPAAPVAVAAVAPAAPLPAPRPMPVAMRGPAADAPPPPLPVCVFRTGSPSDLTDCINRQQAAIAARAPQVRYH